jgi:membrane-associated phospholipid phosphatase
LDPVLKSASRTRLWAVDKVILTYLAFTTALLLGGWREIPGAATLLAIHIAAVALVLIEVKLPNPTTFLFRYWYPLPYVSACYREMAILIPAIRHTSADMWLVSLDYRVWGVHPTVWLERIQSPGLTEFLQTAYTLFVPAVLFVAVALWAQRRYREFQYYALLIALGYLVSYVGYFFVPARGPRFVLKHLQHIPLQGMWLFHSMQSSLDRLESAAYDCFPSGHTELTMLAWWSSRLLGKRVFWVYFGYTLSIIFGTVYLRYHYTVDVLAGALTAIALIVATPYIFRKLQERA